MKVIVFCVIAFLWLCSKVSLSLKFSDVTKHVGLENWGGEIMAYGDFNSDKATDVFVVNKTAGLLYVYLWSREHGHFYNWKLKEVEPSISILHPSDFNGDGVLDLLAVHQVSASTLGYGAAPPDAFRAEVHWGAVSGDGNVSLGKSFVINQTLLAPPLVLDANGDHIMDVFGYTLLNKSIIYLGQENSFSFDVMEMQSSKLLTVRESYFVDMNSDCLADLVLDGDSVDGRALEVWTRDTETAAFEAHPPVSFPSSLNTAELSGPATFADINGDGFFEVVVLSCDDIHCEESSVHIMYQLLFEDTDIFNCKSSPSWTLQWHEVTVVKLQDVCLVPSSLNPLVGDVDLDGFPDLLTLGTDNSNKAIQQPLVLTSSRDSNSNGSVTLRPQWNIEGLGDDYQETISVSFFDLLEDGILDLMVTKQTDGSAPAIYTYKQILSQDHTFLKVLVLSGHCFYDCSAGIEPYGSFLPGAFAAFSTTGRDGKVHKNSAVLHTGSPLQLPFVIFGLGEAPNFIETLVLAAGHSKTSQRPWYYHSSSLVPNSQVILITNPPTDSNKWTLQLYLTPTKLVYSTAAVLCITLVCIAVVVILLHAREKYQDSKERKLSQHKFHFNAM